MKAIRAIADIGTLGIAIGNGVVVGTGSVVTKGCRAMDGSRRKSSEIHQETRAEGVKGLS